MSVLESSQMDNRKAYLTGAGIASLAAAAYLITEGGLRGSNITIFEATEYLGGALDARGNPKTGYTMRGGRMFEEKYNCMFDLLSFIPSIGDPAKSVKQEVMEFRKAWSWNDLARLVDKEGKIVDAHHFGFSERDRLDLIAMTSKPESWFDDKRISDCFAPEFFQTNFWFMWTTIFAFETWHSAIELRRYFRRFVHLLFQMDTLTGILTTRYNNYDSIVRPLAKWLKGHGVNFVTGARVTDVDFRSDPNEITATRIQVLQGSETQTISVGASDLVMVTNGSMVADYALGSNTAAPELITTKRDGSWALWEKLAGGRPEFGNPGVFNNHIDESKWESFTGTCTDCTFFERLEQFSGSVTGKGGLITFKDSAWLLTITAHKNPHYFEQPEGVFIIWGYGLFPDKIGDYVRKPMAQCSGAEIFEEVLRHLKFDADLKRIMGSSIVIPCMMPYITSQFLVRNSGDRPLVVPNGSTNFAFLGQYTEQPDDCVFTVEYSVRSAQTAVFSLLGLDKKPSEFYHGTHDMRVLLDALKTMHR